MAEYSRREGKNRANERAKVKSTEEQMSGTLNGVAESGFIWTIGAIRTTPAKSPGLSQAARMEIAPP